MSLVQVAFDIPKDINYGLLTGELKRFGGVVRYARGPKKGQIVTHLKPIELKQTNEAKGLLKQSMRFISNNKDAIIIGAVGSVLAIGGIVYYALKNREPAVLKVFQKKLDIYIQQIRKGQLKISTVTDLLSSLKELKQHKDYDSLKVTLSIDDIDSLVNKVYNYTFILAKENNVELTEKEKAHTKDPILNLKRNLLAQKRIIEFAEAA